MNNEKKSFFIFTLLILLLLFGEREAVYHQKVTYKAYQQYRGGSTIDYHRLNILYTTTSASNNSGFLDDDWLCSVQRVSDTTTETFINKITTENNYCNTLKRYLPNKVGSENKYYHQVVWSCENNSFPTCGGSEISFNYCVKFFNCQYAANEFYNSSTESIKALISPSKGVVNSEGEIKFWVNDSSVLDTCIS